MNFILDAQLFHLLYSRLDQPLWEKVMGFVTHLGDSKVVLVLASLGALESVLTWARPGRPSGKRKVLPLVSWLGVPMAAFLTHQLKGWVGRPRPPEVIPDLDLFVGEPGRSFPSGHASLAFALAAVLQRRWPKGRWIFFSLACLVALSRVALGLHWPSDVVFGALIGVSCVAIFAWVDRLFSP